MNSAAKIVVLGGGISGLAIAYRLMVQGHDVLLFEKNSEPGGFLSTGIHDDFQFEKGMHALPEISETVNNLISELGLAEDVVYASPAESKRFIFRNKSLHPLPHSRSALFRSKLFSLPAKLKIFMEPFLGKSPDTSSNSLAELISRRFNNEVLHYFFDPITYETYGGCADSLGVKFGFPNMFEYEESFGGIFFGTKKPPDKIINDYMEPGLTGHLFTFKKGVQQIAATLASKLSHRIQFLSEVLSVEKEDDGWSVKYNNAGRIGSVAAQAVVSALPAYAAASVLSSAGTDITSFLKEVIYAPILNAILAYNEEDIKHATEGYGFYIPQPENKSFSFAAMTSALFREKTRPGSAVFTLSASGLRNPDLLTLEKSEYVKKMIADFNEILGITAQPVTSAYRFWSNAIPQYGVRHHEFKEACNRFESQNPGVFLFGNYRFGVSLSEILNSSQTLVSHTTSYLTSLQNRT